MGANTVILKGELHSSRADLDEETALLRDGVDVLVLEGSRSRPDYRLLEGWFVVSVALLAWILESLYHPRAVLTELAEVHGVDLVYTRADDVTPLQAASRPTKVVSAGLFHALVPASVWLGFVTDSALSGSLLLFLGLVLPVLVVRLANGNRPDPAGNRNDRIAEAIRDAADQGETVLAIVGAGHLRAVRDRLPAELVREVRPPAYGVWSLRHVRDVGLPAVKAGFVLFGLYVLVVWVTVHAVGLLSPAVIGALT